MALCVIAFYDVERKICIIYGRIIGQLLFLPLLSLYCLGNVMKRLFVTRNDTKITNIEWLET